MGGGFGGRGGFHRGGGRYGGNGGNSWVHRGGGNHNNFNSSNSCILIK